ncbi:MAG: hypothetical protein ABSH38_01615 [Verrucomicrobiota bacterium]|jgi:hypothetical protein
MNLLEGPDRQILPVERRDSDAGRRVGGGSAGAAPVLPNVMILSFIEGRITTVF